jgi:hypothetical protein
MRITVKQQHMNKARELFRTDAEREKVCPIAQALLEQVPGITGVFVAYHNVCVTRGKKRTYFDLPKSATAFQHAFDGGITVAPQSFNIPLEA